MKPLAKFTFDAIGTHWSIETERPLTPPEKRAITQIISEFDHTYSRFRSDSLVSRIARGNDSAYTFPSSIIELYDIYTRLEQSTDGAVNPLVGQSLERLGYDAEYSLQPSGDPFIPPSFSSVATLHGTILELTQPALIDIGAIGKGYLVDQIAEIVRQTHQEFVVDASGDICVHRTRPEVIGLEDPFDSTRAIGVVRIANLSLCASATNRRAWGDNLHHVIDARTGLPCTTDTIATWAIASTTVMADALATALFFAEPQQLLHRFGDFYYVTMKQDGSVSHNITPIGELYS